MDGKELVKQILNQIPQASADAKRIVRLVKEGGRITGYQLSDNSIVEKAGCGYCKTGPNRRCRHRPPRRYRIHEIHPRRQRKQQPGQPPFCFPRNPSLIFRPTAFLRTLSVFSLFIAVQIPPQTCLFTSSPGNIKCYTI